MDTVAAAVSAAATEAGVARRHLLVAEGEEYATTPA